MASTLLRQQNVTRCLDMLLVLCLVMHCKCAPLILQDVVRQAEALYDTLMKAKSGPAQASKPASANWASTGWKRKADSSNAGVFVAVCCLGYAVHVLRIACLHR